MLVTTTYLEQRDPARLRPAKVPAEPGTIARVDEPSPEFSRFLYTAVGGDWYWLSRLVWTRQQWLDWLANPGFETWVLWLHNTPAGYVEMNARADGDGTDVEFTCVGLLPRFVGRGLGGHLLTTAIRNAWALRERWPELPPVRRVWLHTCTLDGEHALANYTARGMSIYRTEQDDQQLDPTPPGPWPGWAGPALLQMQKET